MGCVEELSPTDGDRMATMTKLARFMVDVLLFSILIAVLVHICIPLVSDLKGRSARSDVDAATAAIGQPLERFQRVSVIGTSPEGEWRKDGTFVVERRDGACVVEVDSSSHIISARYVSDPLMAVR